MSPSSLTLLRICFDRHGAMQPVFERVQAHHQQLLRHDFGRWSLPVRVMLFPLLSTCLLLQTVPGYKKEAERPASMFESLDEEVTESPLHFTSFHFTGVNEWSGVYTVETARFLTSPHNVVSRCNCVDCFRCCSGGPSTWSSRTACSRSKPNSRPTSARSVACTCTCTQAHTHRLPYTQEFRNNKKQFKEADLHEKHLFNLL